MLKEKIIRYFSSVTLAAFVFAGSTLASEKRPATVEDCVCLRRILANEVKISPDRTHVGYLLKAPNLRTNQNDYELLVRDLDNRAGANNGTLIFSSVKELSGLRWLRDGKTIALLENRR